jgi:hypothetical protein
MPVPYVPAAHALQFSAPDAVEPGRCIMLQLSSYINRNSTVSRKKLLALRVSLSALLLIGALRAVILYLLGYFFILMRVILSSIQMQLY